VTTLCDKCQKPIEVGEWPFCPHGFPQGTGLSIVPDSVPGGFVIENLSAQPQTFYSRSEHKRAMDKAGVVPMVRHMPSPGSDRNRERHTQRFV
jgi:hypothetical protein